MLREKTLAAATGVFAVLIILVAVLSQTVLLRGFADLEVAQNRREAALVRDALVDELTWLRYITQDWGQWDAAYAYIRGQNDDFIASNVIDETFPLLNANFILFFDASGALAYSGGFELEAEQSIPIPPSLLADHLAPDGALLAQVLDSGPVSGVVTLPEDVLLLAAAPILPSTGEGSPGGVLVIARFWDITQVSCAVSGERLGFFLLNNGVLCPEAAAVLDALPPGETLYAQPLGENAIAGYALVEDVYGEPSLLLREESPRLFYQEAQRVVRYFTLLLVAAGVVLGGVLLWVLNVGLSRLKRLAARFYDIAESGDFSQRLPVQSVDEIGVVAANINEVLATLSDSLRRAAEGEARQAAILQSVMDAIVMVDRNKRIILFNRAAEELFGYQAADVLGQSALILVPEALRESYAEVGDSFLHGEFDQSDPARRIWRVEAQRADGETFPADASLSQLGLNGDMVVTLIIRDITAREEARAALAQERSLLRSLIDNIPDAVYAKDTESRFILYNQATADLLGVANLEDALGKDDFDFFPQERAAEYFADEQGVVNSGQALINKAEVNVGSDGVERWMLSSKAPLWNAEGQIVGIVGISRDITEYRSLEAARRESEAKYRSLVEKSGDAIYLLHGAKVVLTNPRFLEMLKLTEADLQAPGFDLRNYVAPESQAVVRDRSLAVQSGEVDHLEDRYEFTALDSEGNRIEVEAVMTYFPNPDGIISVQGVLRDITQRKQAEQAIRRAKEELEVRVAARTLEIREQQQRTLAILASVADAVIVTDPDGAVMITNPPAARLLQNAPPEEDLLAQITAITARLYEEDAPDLVESLEVGKLTFQAKASRVVDNGQILGAVTVLHDITRLQELDRLKTKFVDNVSHELRTPIANIKLYLSLLDRGRQERRAEYLAVVHRESERLERLINELLDLSRLDAEQGAAIAGLDLDALIAEVIENNMLQAQEKDIALCYLPQADALPGLWANHDQLVQALTNLVANAIAYTPVEGHVTVISRQGHMPAEETPAVILEVQDDGVGIHADDLPYIFDRFYRGQNPARWQVAGTGLGLAITKEIIERHYGKIQVASQPNLGSTFTVYLPLVAPATTNTAD